MRVFKLLPILAISLTLIACSNSDKDTQDSSNAPSNHTAFPLPTSIPDFAAFKDVKEKKTAFFDYIFAYVVHANLDIKKERDFITSISFKAGSLDSKQTKQLKALCEKYSNSCENVFREDLKTELLNEINFVPAGLALAQSANESSWGTSRFSKQANNYFGQWCYQKGCGIVPSSRNTGAKHEVRSFDSTLDSVAGYMFNINTHPAYELLRKKRESLNEKQLDSNLLSEGLIRYSERGEEYIKELKSMIRINKLSEYDQKMMEILK